MNRRISKEWILKTKGCGLVIYEKGTEDTHCQMIFDMESRTVYATCERFRYKDSNAFIPQSDEHIKYSCKYGHWETEQMHLSLEDIEFMHDMALKLGL